MRKIFLFYALRTFLPISPFSTIFFVEKKRISNSTVHNRVVPWFFMSGILFSMVGPFFILYFGEKNILIGDTVLDLVFLICFFFVPDGKVTPIIAITCMHGASSSLSLLTKGMLYAEGGPKGKTYSTFNAIKRVSSVMSSWMGQDLFYASSEYTPALILSVFTTTCCLITSFFLTKTEYVVKDTLLTTLHRLTRRSFTRNYVFFCLLNIISSTIYVSFAIYSASIFIERRKNINIGSNIMGRYLYRILLPFRAFSFIYIKLLSLFMSVSYSPKYDQNKLIFGYIDGIAKIVSVLFSTLVTRRDYKTDTLAMLSLFLVMLAIIVTFLMGHTQTLVNTYVCYVLGATLSNTLLMLTHCGFNTAPHLATLLSINLTISSIIHVGISYIGRIRKMTAYQKMYLYLGSSVLIYLLALIVRWDS